MNEVEWLHSLDRDDPPPVVDVTAGVMHAVRSRSMARKEDCIFPIAAAVAAIVGIVSMAFVAPTWFEPAPSSPFAGFGEAVNLVLR